MLQATDLKQQMKSLYSPSPRTPVIVDVPPVNFLMVDGSGDPNNSQEYQEALSALYTASYTLKFMIKKERGINYTVMPLEGLWWEPDMGEFSMEHKERWLWTAMIAQPDEVTPEALERALVEARDRHPEVALDRLRLETFDEGLAAQIMHIGPYSADVPTIQRLHAFIHEQGYTFDGHRQKHHEIYLGDPRRAAPEKLRTVVRQPVVRA